MRPSLEGIEGLCRWHLEIISLLDSSSLFINLKLSLRAQFGGVCNSGNLGPQEVPLFPWERWAAIDISIEVSCELSFDHFGDDYML